MMGDNRSDSSEQALRKEADLTRCVESLQRIICDLLIENEKLRQEVAAEQVPGR